MSKNSLTILGCGSALPTRHHFPASQLLELRDKQYLIDCGEGAQIRMRQMSLKTTRLGHLFISHLHGDHVFGLIGLISSFGMLNRTADFHVHSPAPLEELMQPWLRFFCDKLPFKVLFHPFCTKTHALIHSDHSVNVYTIPLNHKIDCAGFLFEEKPRERHLLPEMLNFHQVPVSRFLKIKQGEDYINSAGQTIPNALLTKPPEPPVRYAYCSDTAYCEAIVPLIKGVDLLFHEATFIRQDMARAINTNHSTAEQAAQIASQAEVKKLLLGHYSARYDSKTDVLKEAIAVFPNTVLGEDMKTYGF
jgi:ribonuclease Z